ncbi:MAG: hypothetical protein AB1403_03930 [Candidatus Riflebacteria bacterium]
MKRIFTILPVIFTLVFMASSLEAAKPEWGVVNSSVLIQLHPLMQQFDPATRRFRGTLSEPGPEEDQADYNARLQSRLQAMENTIRQLDLNYAGQITGSGMAARKSYLLYWKKRESLRFYADLLKEALSLASRQGNFYLNMPSDWTLMPVVKGIGSTINEVCVTLAKRNELVGVLDSSVFNSPTTAMATGVNQHWGVWRGEEKAMGQISQSCGQLMFSVRQSFPERSHRPFVAGVVNLQVPAIEMLKSISLPNADVPEE